MIKTEKIFSIENSKLKLLKLLSSYHNTLCDSSKLFSISNPGDKEPSDILGYDKYSD